MAIESPTKDRPKSPWRLRLLGALLLGAAAGACGGTAGSEPGGARGGAQGAGTGGVGSGGIGSGGVGTGGAGAGGVGTGGVGSGGVGSGGRGSGGRGAAGGGAGGSAGGAGGGAAWTLTWSDEFDGPSAQLPDAAKWTYDVGGGGWGNNELENYTKRPENVGLDGAGNLVITLRAESYMGSSYTSARLKTEGLFSQALGRFEARIKIPRGKGVWPAFWMLGADIATNAWPKCGEIDIMENAGREPAVNHGSLHGPGYSGGNPLTGTYQLAGGGALADDFHLYAVEWEKNVVRFYVDDALYETRHNTDVPSGATWVYDHPFFLILNIAIGGAFGGAPDTTTPLPQAMTVDYVRVYAR